MKLIKLYFVFFCYLLPNFLWAQEAHLTHIHINKGSTTRIEISLSQLSHYKVFTLTHPNRLVIDFPKTRLVTDLQKIKLPDLLMKSIRTGYPDADTLRLVFDLNSAVKTKTISQGKNIIVELRTGWVENSKPTFKARPFIIVIDPGHGGRDPGATGEYGTKEKNIVLNIAKRLAFIINKQGNMRGVLTRNEDYFVPLSERLKLAHKGKADLFIAIHADSYFNTRAHGASVYALSQRGATSLAARWLAIRENHSELGGVNLGELEDKSAMVRSVLIDLAQTATINDSLRLGNAVLNSLNSVTKLRYCRVEQAPFMVLKSLDIPSILVELGFISNPQEEKKLNDKNYQNKMAQALFNGIHKYFKKFSSLSE